MSKQEEGLEPESILVPLFPSYAALKGSIIRDDNMHNTCIISTHLIYYVGAGGGIQLKDSIPNIFSRKSPCTFTVVLEVVSL